MEGLDQSTEMQRNVLSFPIKDQGQVGFQTQEDPDDLISALLNEFEFEDNPITLDEVLDKIELPSKEATFLSDQLDEDTELSACLDHCKSLMRKLESKMKRINYYASELDKTL
jgi:hypothetical protein